MLKDEQKLDNFETQDIQNTHNLETEEKTLNDQSDEVQTESPLLFTGDEEVTETNEDLSTSVDLETDLSDINFDDKDDLEIPAFLRRQTN